MDLYAELNDLCTNRPVKHHDVFSSNQNLELEINVFSQVKSSHLPL